MRTLLIAATEPDPTRPGAGFSPPCPPVEASELAQAALDQTAATARSVGADRLAVVLDPGSPLTVDGLETLRPEADEEDERVAASLATCDGPTLVVRSRTPQVTAAQLHDAFEALDGPYGDALVGLTVDESWWALGLATPDPMALLGLPLRGAGSGTHLLDRVHGLGLALGLADRLLAAERFDDAVAIAQQIPDTDFAARVEGLR
ncbi:MAG: glycosyltransferase [Actinomycetota bacterium]